MFDATASTDRLIELILDEDKDVLKQMLTTTKVVATNTDRTYFGRKNSPEERKVAEAARKKAEEERTKKEQEIFDSLSKEVAEMEKQLLDNPCDREFSKNLTRKQKELNAAKKKLEQAKKKKRGNSGNTNVTSASLSGPKVYARVSRRSFGNGSMRPDRTLATVPEGQRLGLLTHPSWLVSHTLTPWTIMPSCVDAGFANVFLAEAFQMYLSP